MRRILLGIAIALLLITGTAAACQPDLAENPVSGRETLVQVSTIDALLEGVYDGVMTYDTLGGYGDFGIGTFAGLDGEMAAVNGDFYQVRADGKAYTVSGDMATPFAAVTFFEADYEEAVPSGADYGAFQQFLDGILPTENAFYAVMVEGTFSYMKTRSVPAQEKPYPKLAEITASQPVFEFNDVAGTLIGFRCPPYVTGVNVAGYHLHFLTEDRDAGGHVLEFTVREGSVFVDSTRDFLMILPGEDSDFYRIDLTPDNQEELEKVEK